MFRHLLVFLDKSLRDNKVLHPILSWIREVLCPYHPVIFHRVAHLQGGVHENTVVAVEHLRIHATHRRADDEVWLFRLAGLTQQRHRLLRTNGQVWRYHRCTR